MLRFPSTLVLSCALAFCAACANFSVRHGGGAHVTGTTHLIQVEGRLENESLRESVGSSVTAYRIGPDGSLLPLTNTYSTTDQDGRYAVSVEVPNGAPVDLLIRADSEFGYGLVVVPTDMMVEKSVPAQPITDETTVEAQVYLAAKASGIWPDNLGVSRLHGLIGPTLATELLHEDDYAAAVGVLSQATSAAAASWGLVLTNPNVGVHEEQLKSVFAAVDWSLLTRDEVLTHAPDEVTAKEAESDFQAGQPLAYGLARIEPMQLSLAAQATAESLALYARQLHGAAQAQAFTDAALLRAGYVTAMVNEALYQAGTLSQRQAVQGAGTVLHKQLFAAAADPAHAQQNIQAAWEHYRSQVTTVLKEAAQGVEHIDFAKAQEAMEQGARETVVILNGLPIDASPKTTAELTSQALARLYAETETQAAAFSSPNPKDVKHQQVRAILAAVGNLAVAARR